MVHGSWLNAHGSCFKARGSRLVAHGQGKFGAGDHGTLSGWLWAVRLLGYEAIRLLGYLWLIGQSVNLIDFQHHLLFSLRHHIAVPILAFQIFA